MNPSERIAQWLAPEREQVLLERERDFELRVNQRVAEVLLKMDPFEPILKKYNIIFSKQYERPEEKLNPQSQLSLFMWAYQTQSDPSFKHLVDWVRDTQGNATLRKGTNDNEWFYGRAAIATITLLVDEVDRLASHYADILGKKKQSFDKNLTVE